MRLRAHILSLGLAVLAATLPTRTARAGTRLVHVPPAMADTGRPLKIEATVDEAWRAQVVLWYRTAGAQRWRSVPFALLDSGRYVARVPAPAVTPPGFEYFIQSIDENHQTTAHFASAKAPHYVAVFDSPSERVAKRELDALGGRRARARVAFEWVDFGARTFELANGQTALIDDRYHRLEADFMYRLLRMPVYSVRFGVTRLLGDAPLGSRADSGVCRNAMTAAECSQEAGFRVGGWFELRFRFGSSTDVDARGLVQATQDGFHLGGRAELRFGPEYGSHIALGTEAIVTVGARGYFRLGWDTVPGLPMSATIEITDFPAPHRSNAVRLVYEVTRPLGNGLRIGLRAGYQARDHAIGGLTLGVNTSLDF